MTFYFDDKVTDVLPREKNDLRMRWFYFSNYEEAEEMLRPFENEETVTILIDQYIVRLLELEVINSANIISVINE